jgi:hypothetical protein
VAVLVRPEAGAVSARTAHRWLERAEDFVTIGLSLWLVAGVFVDGWAHTNLDVLDTIFTPWHAILYSGYLATAIWIGDVVRRRGRPARGQSIWAVIPRGYQLSVVGVMVFGAAGVGDLLWHSAFGIERGLDALLSPTHLGLFVGALLIVSTPFRLAWSNVDGVGEVPSWPALLPALLSLAIAAALTCFMHMYLWGAGLYNPLDARGAFPSSPQPVTAAVRELNDVIGLASVLVTNLILIAPLLILLRRWLPPFGSATLLFATIFGLMEALWGYEAYYSVLAAVAAGLLVDGLIRALRAGPDRVAELRIVATLAPLIVWGLDFLAVQLVWGMPWTAELWGGALVMSSLAGLGISLLHTTSPPTPSR